MSENVLSPTSIKINGTASNQAEAIAETNDLLLAAGAVTNQYLESMLENEAAQSSYAGRDLAIPQGIAAGDGAVLAPGVSFVRYSKAIDWNGEEVRFVIGVASDESRRAEILSKITAVFDDEEVVDTLLRAPSDEAVFAVLSGVNGDF